MVCTFYTQKKNPSKSGILLFWVFFFPLTEKEQENKEKTKKFFVFRLFQSVYASVVLCKSGEPHNPTGW
jgi:hypothetical protein